MGFALFTPPWAPRSSGPLGGDMVGRMRHGGTMLVIATYVYKSKGTLRDYFYVMAMWGHDGGSKLGWIPQDHVSLLWKAPVP